MKLRFTPRATRDIAEIADFIRSKNPAAASQVRDSILDAMQTLVLFPQSGRRQELEGVRKLVTRKFHYLVFYQLNVEHEEIVILAIQHAARDREFVDR